MHARHGSAIFQEDEAGERPLNPHLLGGHAYILTASCLPGQEDDGGERDEDGFPSARLHNTSARNVRARKRMLKLTARAFLLATPPLYLGRIYRPLLTSLPGGGGALR